jgi:glycosyltransferase involved in cell wall biosynthesis
MWSTVFVWENFGPSHCDRCDAVAKLVGNSREIVGLELASASASYDWRSETGTEFKKKTLFVETTIDSVSFVQKAWTLVRSCWSLRPADYLFCHYEEPFIFLTAILLRISGSRVFVMNDSKFDDRRRYLGREVLKSLLYLPYNGAIASGTRTADYLRFLGVPENRIRLNYDTLSTNRIRRLAGVAKAPDGTPFSARHFTIIARMVPKKNISLALDAYAIYYTQASKPRQLHLCGSGPLEAQLRAKVIELGLDEFVVFHGFLQIEDVCPILGTTLALLLPSVEEQFGHVVIEAQAMGLPVIVSENCGARDLLVRNGVNGFVLEPDNPRGWSYFMGLLDQDEGLWRRMATATEQFTALGDASQFASAVVDLLANYSIPPK